MIWYVPQPSLPCQERWGDSREGGSMDDRRNSEAAHDAALDDSFPASDPPSDTSPTRSLTIDDSALNRPVSKPVQSDTPAHGTHA